MRIGTGNLPCLHLLRSCRGPACLAAAFLCLCSSVVRGQESRRPSQLGVLRASVAATDEAPERSAPTFGEHAAVWVAAPGSGETMENAAVEFVTSLFRLSDVHTQRENPAAGLKLSYEAAEFAFRLPVMNDSPLQFFADLGLGLTRLRSRELEDIPVSGYYRLSETFVSALGGVTARLRLRDNFRVFIGARRYLFMNDADGIKLDEVPDADQLLDSSPWTFPIVMGFEFSFD